MHTYTIYIHKYVHAYIINIAVSGTCNYKKITYSKQIDGKLLKKAYFLVVSYLKGVFEIITVKSLYNMRVHTIVDSNWA